MEQSSNQQLSNEPELIVERANQKPVELFDDLDLTALWWDTHSFMNADQRLTMARQVIALCKSDECREMMRIIIADLEMFVAPKRILDVAFDRLQSIAVQHPYFSGTVALSLIYMLLNTGMSIADLIQRFWVK